MPFTFAIGDLHGRADLLEAALSAIDARFSSGTVVFLGDYVDRGPDSRRVIERLMQGSKDGWEWICLKGNHEDLMFKGLVASSGMFVDRPLWIANGGDASLQSYGNDPKSVPQAHLDWLEALPLMHVDLHRVYVHASVDPRLPLHGQSEGTLLWHLYDADDEGGHGDFHVVHGHDYFVGGPLLKKHRTNLDTFACGTGRLVVAVFDDGLAGGPVELIEILGPPATFT